MDPEKPLCVCVCIGRVLGKKAELSPSQENCDKAGWYEK